MGKVADCYLVELGCWVDYTNHSFKRNIYTPDELYLKLLNERYGNVGVFKTVYAYSTMNIEESFLHGDYYLDFDDIEDFEKVRQDALQTIDIINTCFYININDMEIYFSGNKGVHIIINKDLLGAIPHKKLNVIYKYITRFIRKSTIHKTIDTKIYDNKRLFRIPNSKHEKTGLHKIMITYDELVNLKYDDIRSMAKHTRQITKHIAEANEETVKMYNKFTELAITEHNEQLLRSYENNSDQLIRDTPRCIEKLLEDGPIKGTRNQTLAALTSFYKTKGYNYQDTIKLLLEWNSGSISKSEFYKTVNSIYKSNFKFGCRTFKEISVCDYETCPLMKGRRKNVQTNTRDKIC